MYLDAISKYVSINKIDYDTFRTFIGVFQTYVALGGSDYMSYVPALNSCEVLLKTDLEEQQFKAFKSYATRFN